MDVQLDVSAQAAHRDDTVGQATATLATRVSALPWTEIGAELDQRGFAVLPPLLSEGECQGLKALYADETRFRKQIDMGAHAYGEGEYKYFAYPLPPIVADLREAFYPSLAATANRW